jgi:hypothetical protein
MDDTDLDNRLSALAARAPGAQQSAPELTALRSRRRLYAPVAIAPGLVLAIAATAFAGGAAVGVLGVVGLPGAENPGQPLAGANLECMSPPVAAAYLSSHGFSNVVWQVETGSPAQRNTRSVQQATAPEHGYVVPGAFDNGQLIIVVEQREGATGSGACPGIPMP